MNIKLHNDILSLELAFLEREKPMEARTMRQRGSALRQCEVPGKECNPLKCLENLAKTST